MTEPSLNPNQTRAVELDGNVVVPASAGTGKTRVLTERLISRLASKTTSIDRVLVVTFTEKAAAELRERITEKMSAGEALREGREKLDLAYISTIHAFCSRMIRRHFYYLDIDPRFVITTSPFPELMEQRAAETVLKKLYSGDAAGLTDDGRRCALDLVTWLDERAVIATCISVLRFVRSLPSPEEKLESWLAELRRDYATSDPKRLKAYMWWCAEVEKGARALTDGMSRFLSICTSHGAEKSGKAFWGAQKIIADIAAARDVVLKASIINTSDPGSVSKEDVLPHEFIDAFRKGVRDKLRDRLGMSEAKENRRRFEDLELVEKVFEREISSIQYQVALVEMTRAIHKEFQHQKKRRELLDFSDLEQYAYELLSNHSDVADYYRNLFDFVFVDEFQDVNHLQDAIIRKVSRADNLFVVGDSKQSIYGFRQTDPSIFEERALVTAAAKPEQVIPLVGNYRSRADILVFVNEMLGQLFIEIGTDYAGQSLTAGDERRKGQQPRPSVEVLLIDPTGPASAADTDDGQSDDEGPDAEAQTAIGEDGGFVAVSKADEIEAAHLARRICEVKAEGYKWGDIAVLVRSSAKVKAIEDALKQGAIPYSYQDMQGFYERPEVRDLLALLAVVDNPFEDIKFAAVLRSPVVNLTDDDLTRLALQRLEAEYLWETATRIVDGGCEPSLEATSSTLSVEGIARLSRIVPLIRKWAAESRGLSISEVVWRILTDTGYATQVLAMRHGAKRRANLLKVYHLARTFEAQEGGTLAAFTKYIQTVRALSPPEGEAQVEVTDAVNVLTVHKAKGLEFPVVFVANMGTQFNLRDAEQADLLFHRDEGFAIRVTDPTRMQKFATIGFRRLAEIKKRASIAEELRILYVALTRAKERLICTSVLPRKEALSLLAAERVGEDKPVFEAKSAAAWLVSRLMDVSDARESLRTFAESGKNCEGRTVTFGAEEKVSIAISLLVAAPPKEEERQSSAEWDKVSALILGRQEITMKPSVQQRVDSFIADLAKPYAFADDVKRLAKLTVTEVKEAWLEETQPFFLVPRAKPSVAARFAEMQEGEAAQASVFGTKVHAAMQMIDLSAGTDVHRLALEVERVLPLVGLVAEQASRAKRAIGAFFESETGRVVAAHSSVVEREVPFTLRIPARSMSEALRRLFSGEDVRPDSAGLVGENMTHDLRAAAAKAEEGIIPGSSILQGKIDALVKDPAGWWILDYKTDKVAADSVRKAADGYRIQMELYKLAAETIFGVRISKCVLYFLTPGAAVGV